MHKWKNVCLSAIFLILSSCNPAPQSTSEDFPGSDPTERWYSQAQVATGAQVFANNCAVCHGDSAQGTAEDWRERLDDGSFPPPPLNGSAHAWHHPRSLLIQVINEGGVAFGGKMPGFEEALSDDEKFAAIAYFQNFWSDGIYADWVQMGGTN